MSRLGFHFTVDRFATRGSPYVRQLAHADEAIAAIGREPESITKRWLGWTYRRWATFGPYRPIDDLLEIDVPILVVHGERDEMAAVALGLADGQLVLKDFLEDLDRPGLDVLHDDQAP